MAVGREGGKLWVPWILKILAKIGCFPGFEWGKPNFTPLVPPETFGKTFTDPHAKKTSDAQVQGFHMNFDFATVFMFEKSTKETSTCEI